MTSSYQISITEDGSPTLLCSRPGGEAEKMHHSGGALSESFYIYHEAALEVLRRQWPFHVVSLGLGLGYNEWIALGMIFRGGMADWKLWSFEADENLRQQFLNWLNNFDSGTLVPAFEEVLARVANKLEISHPELKAFARNGLVNSHLQIRGRFPDDAGGLEGCTCVFYDAFSKKMDPDLWDEELLTQRLSGIIGTNCVLATYAATGTLNRALERLGFRLTPKKGFLGKRESTLAIREEIR